jgi:murein DD-endopeptidase MepM/ murein hydrolase activator NlpD
VLVACLLGIGALPAAAGQSDVDRAESRLRDAQRKANDAVQGLEKAERDLEDAETAVEQAQKDLEESRRAFDVAAGRVRGTVVHTYTTGGASTQISSDDIYAIARGHGYLDVATGISVDQLDEMRARKADLDAREKTLTRRRKTLESRVQAFEKLNGQLSSNIDKIGSELAAARQKEAELKRLAAEAAAADKARLEREASAAEANRKRLEEAQRRESQNRPSGGGGSAAKGPWTCPVQGGATFSNDYGFARSGGRRHQGNDMFAPRGTPAVAPVGGTFRRSSSSLGGIAYHLNGDDGNSYYGAHLQGYSSLPPGRVSMGQVIGYVGDTGNARGTSPHLHFEIHPGGGGPVNPYPTISRYC